MNYKEKYIRDWFGIYTPKTKHIIKYPPKLNKDDLIIEEWFENEDVEGISKISGKTTSEIVNILKNNGIL